MSEKKGEAPTALRGTSDSWPCHDRGVALYTRVCRKTGGNGVPSGSRVVSLPERTGVPVFQRGPGSQL